MVLVVDGQDNEATTTIMSTIREQFEPADIWPVARTGQDILKREFYVCVTHCCWQGVINISLSRLETVCGGANINIK